MINATLKINHMNYFQSTINNIHYEIKLFLINKEHLEINIYKLKKENLYQKFSNTYSLSHLHEISNYFKVFRNIKEIYDDIVSIFKINNFMISQNQNKNLLQLHLKTSINNKVESIDLLLQKCEKYNYKKNTGKDGKKLFINNTQDLNKLLTNFDRKLNELETYKFKDKKTIALINKLEKDNHLKDKKIQKLENKIKYYEKIFTKDIKNKSKISNNNKREENSSSSSDNTSSSYSISESIEANTKNNNNNTNKTNGNGENNKTSFEESLSKKDHTATFLSDKDRKSNKKKNNDKSEKVNSSEKKPEALTERKNISEKNIGKKKHVLHNSVTMVIPKKDSVLMNPEIKSNQIKKSRTNKSASVEIKNERDSNIHFGKRAELKKLINSRIIFSKEEYFFIMDSLNNKNNGLIDSIKLIYRASIDGDTYDVVKIKCGGKFKLLILFYTEEGYRFGVYTERAARNTMRKGICMREVPGTSFILSLNNLVCFDCVQNKISVNNNYDNLLCFGWEGGDDGDCEDKKNWLIFTEKDGFIGTNYQMKEKQKIYMDFDAHKILGTKLEYTIKDIEIFGVNKG